MKRLLGVIVGHRRHYLRYNSVYSSTNSYTPVCCKQLLFISNSNRSKLRQCIINIGLIIKSVCLCLSQSVSLSHRQIERSTGRAFPPIFTKLASKVESQEMRLPIIFGVEIRHIYVRQTRSGIINCQHCTDLISNMSKIGQRTLYTD